MTELDPTQLPDLIVNPPSENPPRAWAVAITFSAIAIIAALLSSSIAVLTQNAAAERSQLREEAANEQLQRLQRVSDCRSRISGEADALAFDAVIIILETQARLTRSNQYESDANEHLGGALAALVNQNRDGTIAELNAQAAALAEQGNFAGEPRATELATEAEEVTRRIRDARDLRVRTVETCNAEIAAQDAARDD